ncbi:MAG: orotidine-5'-phosphate decarboxylase [Nitrospirae bacterium]|nr:orotidine-5'-phosphate decarboxylase [Nitrospirota bacterium]MCL5421406.1 orotidine-5'-phosphate decarboxylase [Nitrospirota bacterium]
MISEKRISFSDYLIANIIKKKSHVIVGLDPDYDNLPESIKGATPLSIKGICMAITEFNCRLIDAIYDLVPAIKPQIAFYERYGIEGIRAFIKTVKYGKKKGLIVIEDAKRNDIGSTAKAYSDGHIGKVRVDSHDASIFDVDAMTVNPYLGSDGILPFLDDVKTYSKGIFILVKTSNPSSVDLQDIKVRYEGQKARLYEVVAKLVNRWGSNTIGSFGYSSVGAVVGATFPRDARKLRKLMPKAYFLVPGYGAQGGKASDVINCFNKDGCGALIAASRSINYAYRHDKRFKDSQFAEAAREAVIGMNTEINNELRKNKLLNW